ncbi:MAG: Rossmann-like and DUF2520 domain-containing protein [Pseudomonadota bacterium]|nr:Rossmann-like and DUF2520 domain-containing protein [Pseudomonadota bacterium]
MAQNFKSIAIVGLGRVGTSLAVLLWRQGVSRLRVCDPNPAKVKALKGWINGPVTVCSTPAETVVGAELVFLAVQDRYIVEVADNLAEFVPGADLAGLFFAHLSGSLTSTVLQLLAARDAITFSLHPLQSIADVEGGVEVLAGSYFSFEGDERALPVAERVVAALAGNLVCLAAADKVLYHAAAVVSSNFFIALEEMAITMMTGIGVDADTARRMLLPLIRGSFENLERVSPAEALTGPIVRGDDQTVAAHLAALREKFPDYLGAYRLLAGLNVDLAKQKGVVSEADFPSLKSCNQ